MSGEVEADDLLLFQGVVCQHCGPGVGQELVTLQAVHDVFGLWCALTTTGASHWKIASFEEKYSGKEREERKKSKTGGKATGT